MLMGVGYSPEVIQAAYRIGDSTTNIITPMMSYFGLILAVAARYERDLGIGTMIATMLPYSIFVPDRLGHPFLRLGLCAGAARGPRVGDAVRTAGGGLSARVSNRMVWCSGSRTTR